MIAGPLLGMLCIPLPMTQCGHWIYTHATLGFLITLLVDPFVLFISYWASSTHFLIMHSHEFLLTLLGFHYPITLSFILGAHRLFINALLSLLRITSGLLWPILTFLHHILPMGLLFLSPDSFRPVCFLLGHMCFNC